MKLSRRMRVFVAIARVVVSCAFWAVVALGAALVAEPYGFGLEVRQVGVPLAILVALVITARIEYRRLHPATESTPDHEEET